MEDLNLDLDNVQNDVQQKLQTKDRFAKLTEKGIESEKARELAENKAQAESDRAAKAEKDLEFYKSFSQLSSKHPGASDFQDQIKERVDKGYDPEDATLAVLAKEGRLSGQTVQVARPDIAGGSAQTNLGDGGGKNISEMTQAEKAEALMQAEKEGFNLLRFS